MSDQSTHCIGIKADLLAYLEKWMEVSADEGACVVTLPTKTIDGRYIEVFVEQTVSDVLLVHDGGNAVAELFLQGIHITEARSAALKAIAKSYNVSFSNSTFTAVTKLDTVNATILAIAQCASLAMIEVLKHVPIIDEERIAAIVRRTLEGYRPEEVDIRYNMVVTGSVNDRRHVFDAVVFPRIANRNAVAVKTLGTGYNPQVQSQLYGFLALDLRGTIYDKWPRLAVVAKADRWPADALTLVRKLSAETLELKAGEDEDIRRRLLPTIEKLAA